MKNIFKKFALPLSGLAILVNLLCPIKVHTYTVTGLPIKKCHEDIKVTYYATDGGDSFGGNTCNGKRDIPSDL